MEGFQGLLIIIPVAAMLYFVVKAAKNAFSRQVTFSERLRDAQRKREAEKKGPAAGGFDKEI